MGSSLLLLLVSNRCKRTVRQAHSWVRLCYFQTGTHLILVLLSDRYTSESGVTFRQVHI